MLDVPWLNYMPIPCIKDGNRTNNIHLGNCFGFYIVSRYEIFYLPDTQFVTVDVLGLRVCILCKLYQDSYIFRN